MKPIAKICLAGLFVSVSNHPVIAQGFERQSPELRFGAEIDTVAQVSDQSSDIAQLELFSTPTLSLSARFRWRNERGDQILLEPGVTVRSFAGGSELDDNNIFLFGNYTYNLPSIDRAQLRFRAGIERNARFPEERFLRYTAQAALNLRQDGGRSATYTLRYRYRDQNEGNSFDGFDQSQYLASARYSWFSRERPLELFAVTPFLDIRDADADNFASDALGVRVQARYRVEDDLTVTFRANALMRDFDDIFSAAFPVAREDRRISVESEIRKEVGENGSLFGAIGYESNNSNIAVRDYSGATFRIGYELSLP